MSIRKDTPCDHGECPYDACYNRDCEYWCGADEPQDDPQIWEDDEQEVWDAEPDENVETFKIDDLFACAWQDAIRNVGEVVGMERNHALREEWGRVEEIARNLGVRFDVNGEIIR